MMNVELTQEELNMVTGGDYGDAEKDNKETSMYQVGQYVEVYWTPFHHSTKRQQITSKRRSKNGIWFYKVNIWNNREYTAERFES